MSETSLEQRIMALNAREGTSPVSSADSEKRTYSIEEIQQILDISRSTAYSLIKRKLFKSVKVGKSQKRASMSG